MADIVDLERGRQFTLMQREDMPSKMKAWHRRHAIQLASQLSDHQEDQLLILEAVREVVLGFLPVPKSG